MLKIFLFSMLIIAISIVFISIRVYAGKDGRMQSFHIHDSDEMKKRGIGCVIDQDRAARKQGRRKQDGHKTKQETETKL
jgi:hypothetical protein